MIRTIIDFIKGSNRWKHLVGGAILGMLSTTLYVASLVSSSVGAAMEYKDKAWGGRFDCIDLAFTIAGGLIGYSIRMLIIHIFHVLV